MYIVMLLDLFEEQLLNFLICVDITIFGGMMAMLYFVDMIDWCWVGQAGNAELSVV